MPRVTDESMSNLSRGDGEPALAAALPACVALGSNLGDRAGAIHRALAALDALPATRLIASSSLRETAAACTVPTVDPGGPYLNAAALLFTRLPARELLQHLHAVEIELGRDRSRQPHGSARVIDLDLLLYAEDIIDEPGLVVPHPGLHERRFVLEPLAEIAPDMVVPTRAVTVAQALDALCAP